MNETPTYESAVARVEEVTRCLPEVQDAAWTPGRQGCGRPSTW